MAVPAALVRRVEPEVLVDGFTVPVASAEPGASVVGPAGLAGVRTSSVSVVLGGLAVLVAEPAGLAVTRGGSGTGAPAGPGAPALEVRRGRRLGLPASTGLLAEMAVAVGSVRMVRTAQPAERVAPGATVAG